MVPSAVRTLSVVTLLSAVSGTVFLIQDHKAGSSSAVNTSATLALGAGGTTGPGAAVASLPTPRAESAAYQVQIRAEAAEAAERKARADRAAAKLQAKAKVKAKADAEAAADRRRQQVRERASRSARRDPQALARMMAADRGRGAGEFSCLKSLWNRESGWNYRAMNPSSGAYGIPQSLPGRKMASAGADWRTNPATQIKWGLGYIEDRYGSPCGAWGHSQSSGWY